MKVCEYVDVSLHRNPCFVSDLLRSISRNFPNLLIESFMESRQKGSASCQNDIVVEVDLQVVVTLLNCVKGYIGKAAHFRTYQSWIEDNLC